ncbi:MAG: hypothetical protein KKG92_14605 [Gammaproteobacteria bacterium]|nr:hypothetical protein [Gammaproteobacteria bacterium]
MLTVRTGAASQEVLQGAQHILFVEGTKDGLDVTVLHELLTPKLRVEPLGASFSVRSVATALHEFHPEYWFVIDRDDWDDATVDASWRGFPDPAKDNLLIWRRKELENHFLEPAWACNSKYFKPGKTSVDLGLWLAAEASKVLWLEAANRVLIAKRNRVKRSPGSLLKQGDLHGCSRDQVVEKLVSSPLLSDLATTAKKELAKRRVRLDFDKEVETLSGGNIPLTWGHGSWRDLMSGKAFFHSMVSEWFVVPDNSKGGNARLSGRSAQRAVAVDLLRSHQDTMPQDFSVLRQMLEQVV